MAWKIDESHSSIEFTVKHMMITKVRGSFSDFDGTISIDPQNLAASTAEGSVRTASINTRDEKRDAHLRGEDFFDVENHPAMTFRTTAVQRVAEDQYRVTGDLTIKGNSREVTWDVTDEGQAQDPWGGTRRALSARTTINRKNFDLTWNVALETGGFLVGDDIKINAELQLVEVPEQALATA